MLTGICDALKEREIEREREREGERGREREREGERATETHVSYAGSKKENFFF